MKRSGGGACLGYSLSATLPSVTSDPRRSNHCKAEVVDTSWRDNSWRKTMGYQLCVWRGGGTCPGQQNLVHGGHGGVESGPVLHGVPPEGARRETALLRYDDARPRRKWRQQTCSTPTEPPSCPDVPLKRPFSASCKLHIESNGRATSELWGCNCYVTSCFEAQRHSTCSMHCACGCCTGVVGLAARKGGGGGRYQP